MPQPRTRLFPGCPPSDGPWAVGVCPLAPSQVHVLGVRDRHVAGGVRDGERRRQAVHDDGLVGDAACSNTAPRRIDVHRVAEVGLAVSLMPMMEGRDMHGRAVHLRWRRRCCTAFTTWSVMGMGTLTTVLPPLSRCSHARLVRYMDTLRPWVCGASRCPPRYRLSS